MRDFGRALAWVCVYVGICVAPLALSLSDLAPGRGFVINLSVALGFVGLSMLGLQFALAARSRAWSRPFGVDAVLQFHQQISYVAIVFILAHPILLFVENSAFLKLLNPATNPLRAKLGIASVLLLLGLVALSVWRRQLGFSYERWQMVHSLVAVAVVITALLHALLVGYYISEPWEQGLFALFSVAFIGLGVWVRIIRPIQRRKHRWTVAAVTTGHGGASTITLEPVDAESYGDRGFVFEGGQFAWILARRSPFALTYHPFSISSSAEQPERISFTIKAAGRFTESIPSLAEGDSVYLDGPYGTFTIECHEGPGFVFVGAGVGVTPLLSMLRTLADRGDRRPCVLFLGNRDWTQITAREHIEALSSRLDLRVVHVMSHPDDDWEGERGYLRAEVLERYLPVRRNALQYFVCGPQPMMDAVEHALSGLGIPAHRVHSERFAMV